MGVRHSDASNHWSPCVLYTQFSVMQSLFLCWSESDTLITLLDNVEILRITLSYK